MTGFNHGARSADAADALALCRLLEDEVVPAFYDRGRSQPPGRRAVHMKAVPGLRAATILCAAQRESVRWRVHAGIAEPG